MRVFVGAFACAAALVAVVLAEAPLPGGGWNTNGGGNGGGYGGNGGGGAGGSGPLLQKPTGPQTMEGLMVDPQLLEQVKMVLLQHESESASANGGSNGPSSSYGPPRNTDRIVGLMLEQPVQSIQLAEYWQGDQQPPSNSYGPPSGSYGAPQ
uniref:Uncharacterized protein n=1 Tax=Anopheles farauti TaxID=69004 RepID=A0A182QC25_9DIPT